MFTGIITAIGTIREVRHGGDLHAVIACPFDPAGIAMGASIACSGTCLTVVDKAGVNGNAWFAVDISGETVSRTVPGRWNEGRQLNLEPALKLGDELGGHIVTGHVDGVGTVGRRVSRRRIPAHRHFRAARARTLPRRQGLDHRGRRLADRERHRGPGRRSVPLRAEHHSAYGRSDDARRAAPGDGVNLEIDVLARYLQRMQSLRG